MLVIGGGGYKIRNVSRCWTFETSILTQQLIPDDLPFNGTVYTVVQKQLLIQSIQNQLISVNTAETEI